MITRIATIAAASITVGLAAGYTVGTLTMHTGIPTWAGMSLLAAALTIPPLLATMRATR